MVTGGSQGKCLHSYVLSRILLLDGSRVAAGFSLAKIKTEVISECA